MARVAVIGAGVGGLCAALRLAAAGHDVTVYEQAGAVGGKLGVHRRDGFTFDTGPSLLTWPQVFDDTFAAAAAQPRTRLADHVDLHRLDPAFHYRFADGTALTVPGGSPAEAADAMGDQLGGTAATDWRALLEHAERVWSAVRGPFLSEPLDGPGDLLRHSRRLRDLRTVAPWRTLRGTGRRFLRDARQRMLLDRYATYSGSDPRRAPAALAVVPWLEQTHGAWYLRGGLRTLAGALGTATQKAGATVHTDTPVTGVRIEAGRVAGVRLAGGRLVDADIVVSNADAAHLYSTLLPPAVTRAPLRRLRRATPSLSGFVLLLALEARAGERRHHTVSFPSDYDDEFDSIFGRAPRPVPDPAVYVTDAEDAPAGWFVLVNAPRHDPADGVDWDAPGLADDYADRIVDKLDVRDRLRWREIRTPADLQRETGAPGGSIYGTSSNGPSAAFLRPANRSPVPGLFLVGGSAHPGGGLPLVAQSAAIVARLVGPG